MGNYVSRSKRIQPTVRNIDALDINIERLINISSALKQRIPTGKALAALLAEIEGIQKNIGELSGTSGKKDYQQKQPVATTEDVQQILKDLPKSAPENLKKLLEDRNTYKSSRQTRKAIKGTFATHKKAIKALQAINNRIPSELQKYNYYSKQLSETLNKILNITKMLLKSASLDPESLPEDFLNMTDKLKYLRDHLSSLEKNIPTLEKTLMAEENKDSVDRCIDTLDDICFDLKGNMSATLSQVEQLIKYFDKKEKGNYVDSYWRNIQESITRHAQEIHRNVSDIQSHSREDLITLLEITNEKLQTIREQLNYINSHITMLKLHPITLIGLQDSINALDKALKKIPSSEQRASVTQNMQFITNQIKVIQAQQAMLSLDVNHTKDPVDSFLPPIFKSDRKTQLSDRTEKNTVLIRRLLGNYLVI